MNGSVTDPGGVRSALQSRVLVVVSLAVLIGVHAARSWADPVIVDGDWSLLRTIEFNNPMSARYNPVDGFIYMGQRGTTDGLYRINAYGFVSQISGGSNTAAICVHPDSGSVFQSEDYGGIIYRTALGATGRQTWVSGLHDGDDDPVGMAIAPADYAGELLAPGQALVVDRGNSGLDEIWIWSPDTPEGEVVLHADAGILIDAVDVAIDASSVYVVDTGLGSDGVIWEVGAGGVLSALTTSEPIADPAGVTFDPWTDDLLVFDQGGNRLVRVDRATGQVDDLIIGFATTLGWAAVDITADGRRMLVTDFTSDRIYEFGRCGPGPGFADCDGNGVHDGCDVALGTYPDCNANGTPDQCDLADGTSEDCNADDIPDECPICPPVEVVFIMDTSASMDDEAAALCGSMSAVIAQLEATGVQVDPLLLGICNLPGGPYGCLEDHIINLLGTEVPGDPPEGLATLGDCPGGLEVCQEDWGRAVAVVAGRYPWQPAGESLRMVIPLSDEGSWCGDPVTTLDQESVDHAIAVAQAAGVIVSPVTGTGSSSAVIALAQQIADATGGQRFSSSQPAIDIATGVAQLVLDACIAATDCNDNGQLDECDIADGTSEDLNGNGIPDECEAVAVGDGTPRPPARLYGCRPNPFNPRTTITYEIATPGPVLLQVFDLKGRLITTLVDAPVAAGVHEVGWTGRDAHGRELPSGIYLSRLEAARLVAYGRMALVR
jgi:hypothetical protein